MYVPSWAPTDVSPDSTLDRIHALCAGLCTVETTCAQCGGRGETETTRTKRLTELSNTQLMFLFEADSFRETGGEDPEEVADTHTGPQHGRRPSPSHPGASTHTPPGQSPGRHRSP